MCKSNQRHNNKIVEIYRRNRYISKYVDFNDEIGSGYPSDPKTKDWLAKHKHKVFGYPNLIRFSWQTTKTIL